MSERGILPEIPALRQRGLKASRPAPQEKPEGRPVDPNSEHINEQEGFGGVERPVNAQLEKAGKTLIIEEKRPENPILVVLGL